MCQVAQEVGHSGVVKYPITFISVVYIEQSGMLLFLLFRFYKVSVVAQIPIISVQFSFPGVFTCTVFSVFWGFPWLC